jgi:sigma-B regulation protein RsbU (phosphoserine phosphatase)
VGKLPPAAGLTDVEIQRPAPLMVVDWATGQPDQQSIVLVRTRPSALYPKLFASSDFSQDWGRVLIAIAIVFGIIVILALVIGTRLTRTVTRAVAQLYMATHHINKGDFAYRIPVKSNDQLAALAKSFNSMAESLQGLMREQKEKQRLENELVIAQEVQAQLFPQHIAQMPGLEVYGFCRPARTVSGDYYDFVAVDPNRMVMAVGDVSGKGISAALLMATIHSAVRAYTLEGIPILREPAALTGTGGPLALAVPGVEVSTAALLTLLNQQLYESTPAEKYATLFLSYYDDRERKLTYSNAGHLPPLVLARNGSIRRLDCGGTVVGLFDQVEYEESVVHLSDGEIFLAYSDGVTEPENDYGEFGEQRLLELVWENRQLPLARICELVTAAVDDWIGAKEQPDDVTLVLARAR